MEYQRSIGLGVDITDAALDIARKNCAVLNLKDRCKFLLSDWLSVVDEEFDCIVCNPPYISLKDWISLPKHIQNFEPKCALTDRYDGFFHYRKIINDVHRCMKKGSYILLEIGKGQEEIVCAELEKSFNIIAIKQDINLINRVIIASLL